MSVGNTEKTIFDKVRELDFSIGEYVVVGGAMEAYGLRKAHDIDIVVTPALYKKLKSEGWAECDCEQCHKSGRILLKGEGVDILPDYSCGEEYRADTQKLIEEADVIYGIPFVQLHELIKWKKAADRPKDQKDIQILENHLSKRPNHG